MKSTFAMGHVLRRSLAVSMLLGSVACSTSPNNQTGMQVETPDTPVDMPVEKTACQEQFGDDCGKACAADDDCIDGLYCAAGACSADCLHSSDCAKGTCSAKGKCVEEDNIVLDPVETDPHAPDNSPTCIEGQVEFKPVVPQVWLLLDRSGSMSSSFGSVSRWAAMGDVLLGDPALPGDRGVVGEFEDRVAFGVVFYTSGSSSTGCILDLESVALAANNYRDIRQRYNKLGPSGGTPTADSIAATVAVAATSDLTGGPKVLVLATDGEPGSCATRPATATTEVENEVAKAFSKGIQTFAISIATGTDVQHMQRVANIGVGKPASETAMPAKLYEADNSAALKDSFSTILSDVPRSCVFSLNGRVKAENASEGKVVLDGQALGYEDSNGWTLKSPDQVELLGSACDEIRAGEDKLDIDFPCKVFTPVE
jgi:hypothetical protein